MNILDSYRENAMKVVKDLEPKLNSVHLSCDIDTSQLRDEGTAEVELTLLSSQMENAFSSKTWFPELKNTLESRSVGIDSTWITEPIIPPVTEPNGNGGEEGPSSE
ncbi:unnamed protein product [Schistosoma turkestanicum]|nr:unnamed protein product [Schistosoma turkestanicum]